MKRRTYSLSLATALVLLLTSSLIKAQTAPVGLSLQAIAGDSAVDLSWSLLDSVSADYYLLYRAEVANTDTGLTFSYTRIDSTADTTYQDTTSPPPMTAFVYLVRAFTSGGIVSSNLAKVYVNSLLYHRDHVVITSIPPLYATVDSLYRYQVQAMSSDTSATLKYHLLEHPLPMTIDTSTGLISWTPALRGWREVQVIVTSSKGGFTGQEFVVRVAGVNATVTGVITDTLGNPLPHVLVRLYQRVSLSPFHYHAITDSAGEYSIAHVDAGRFLVRATPLNQNYLPAWYNSVLFAVNATPVIVTKDSTYTANIQLENRFHIFPRFNVSGVVTDTDGNVVKGAWVVFARAGFVLTEARETQQEWEDDQNFRDFFEDIFEDAHANHDFRLDTKSPFVFITYVDSTGAYKDTLPEGRYFAFARASRYYRTWYNNEHGILNADILSLTTDTTNINFDLTHFPPVPLGQISGTVFDSTDGEGVPSRLIAFRDIWDFRDTLRMHVIGAYFADADSSGSYAFNDLPPGYYKVLALPLGSYSPSFYSLTGTTVRWKEATAIPIDGSAASGIDIYVMPLPDSGSGYVSINGTVTTTGSVSSRYSGTSSVVGVNGALVYACDADGNILGYGSTDVNGNYTISGLAPGTYNVFTDAMGYGSSTEASSSPTYDANGNPVPSTSNFVLTPETPTAVHETVIQPSSYSLEQNYPNPFNPTTQIAFNIPANEHVTVTIFNILGQRLATLVDGDVSAGYHVITWNGRNSHGEFLPSGVYFYRLSTPGFTAVKKMLLLK